MDKNYTKLTKIEVASILAVYQALNGEKRYLNNIIGDITQVIPLSWDEKEEVSLIAIEEITSISQWNIEQLLAYFALSTTSLTFIDYETNDKRILSFKGNYFYKVLHNEILRRMK